MNWPSIFQSVFKYLLISVIMLITGFWLRGVSGCNAKNSSAQTEIIYDTNTVIRYLDNLKKDTADVKWFEKIVKEYVPAEKIYVQRVDTVFIEKIKNFDVMLKVEKDDEDLTITAFNKELGVLKEMHYKVYGDKITITSKTNDVDVKSSKFDWKGIYAFYSAGMPTDSLLNRRGFNSINHSIGIGSELSYKNKLSLGLSEEYNVSDKSLMTKLNLKYFLIR